MEKHCATCKWWDAEHTEQMGLRLFTNTPRMIAKCLYKLPPLPLWAELDVFVEVEWDHYTNACEEDCPVWEPREKETV